MKRNKDVIILYVIIVGLLMIGDESIRNVLDPNYFQFKVEGSIKTKLPRPLAPEKIYEIQLAAIEMQEVDEGVWSSRQFSLNKKFSESEEIISDCVSKLKFDRGPALPRDIKLAITFEDITGQRRWIKYTKESTGSTKHIHGEGVPEFLKDD